MNTIPLVTLAVSRGAEVYAGKPTGRTAYRAESIDCAQTGSVLGRGNTPQDAIRDWKRRATDDGYQIEEHRIATVKPRQTLTLAEFVTDLTSPNGETVTPFDCALPGPATPIPVATYSLPPGYSVERMPDPANRPALDDGMTRAALYRVTVPGKKPFNVDLFTRGDRRAPHGWEATQDSTTNESGYYSSGGLAFDGETLEDYDGVYFLPLCVCITLRALGFTVSDNCLASPL